MRRFPSPALLALLCCITCSESSAPQIDAEKIALGTWGGSNAGVIAGDTSVHVHIGCTYGDVSGHVMLDDEGRFDVEGSYVLRAYPIAVGPSLPARFTGRVTGAVLSLTVVVNDTVQKEIRTLGPAYVRFGEVPRLGPCPICVPRSNRIGGVVGTGWNWMELS